MLVASLCRDAAAIEAGAPGAVVNVDLADALRDLGRAWGMERLSEAFGTIARARQALDRNASPKLVADWVGVRL
jgi:hypothetical protein